MNKFVVLALLVFFVAPTSVFAVTDQQLQDADNTLRQMDSKISVLRGYVQEALVGKIGSITLTTGQKDELRQKYIDEKSQLRDLYLTLP